MAVWNSFCYICTRALYSFPHCRAASTVIPLRPMAIFTPSIQPSVSLLPVVHWLRPSTPFWPYGTHPFFKHAQTISILSDLLYSLTPFLFQLCYAPIPNSIHSRHSNQTSQTLHLKNIHFASLSTSNTLCLCPVQRHYPQSSIAQDTFLRSLSSIPFTSSICCHATPFT